MATRRFDSLLALRPADGFDFIMADPPWRFVAPSAKGEGKNPSAHYSCLSLEDIADLPVAQLAARDCLLWLWATNPMLPQAMDVLRAWGFEFKTAGHWAKRTINGHLAFGTGYIFRTAGEPYLIGTIGSPKTTNSVRSVIDGLVREHRRKPEEGYAAAEQLIPHARRLEIFSRMDRPGWSVWGDEAGKFSN